MADWNRQVYGDDRRYVLGVTLWPTSVHFRVSDVGDGEEVILGAVVTLVAYAFWRGRHDLRW